MPYKQFSNYLFDGKYNEDPPEELCRPSSPISQLYAISLFMKCGDLNHFLNKHLNTFTIFQIPKDEVFKFIKNCIKDFNISKHQAWYFSKRQKKNNLFDILSKRYPLLKEYEIYELCDLVNKSEDKNKILEGLGLKVDYKKTKGIKDKKIKKVDNKKEDDKLYNDLKINDFLQKNFVVMDL